MRRDRSFTGQDQDTTSGIYDFMFRRYDGPAGRWLSPDPLGWGAVQRSHPQSLNRYAYVMNNPLNLTDALGLDDCTSGDDNNMGNDDDDCFFGGGGDDNASDDGSDDGASDGDGGPQTPGSTDINYNGNANGCQGVQCSISVTINVPQYQPPPIPWIDYGAGDDDGQLLNTMIAYTASVSGPTSQTPEWCRLNVAIEEKWSLRGGRCGRDGWRGLARRNR